MALNGLSGPYALSDSTIDAEVKERSAGVYLLDGRENGGGFSVSYVGRSDADVNNQLHVHVGRYRRFKFRYYSRATSL